MSKYKVGEKFTGVAGRFTFDFEIMEVLPDNRYVVNYAYIYNVELEKYGIHTYENGESEIDSYILQYELEHSPPRSSTKIIN